MAVGPIPGVDSDPNRPGDFVPPAGIILPACFYSEPIWETFPVGDAGFIQVADRDIQRELILFLRASGGPEVYIRPGTNVLTNPITIPAAELVASLRYVDYLTVVTGEFFANAAAPTSVTVGIVRRL